MLHAVTDMGEVCSTADGEDKYHALGSVDKSVRSTCCDRELEEVRNVMRAFEPPTVEPTIELSGAVVSDKS